MENKKISYLALISDLYVLLFFSYIIYAYFYGFERIGNASFNLMTIPNKVAFYMRPFPQVDTYYKFIDCAVEYGLSAVEGFCQGKHVGVLTLTKIVAAVEFRQADYISTLIGGVAHPTQAFLQVVLRSIVQIKLYNGNLIHILVIVE